MANRKFTTSSLMLVIVITLAACGGAATDVTPAVPSGTAVFLTNTPVEISKPTAELEPSPTSMPLPTAEELKVEFDREVVPLVTRLLAAAENPDVMPGTDYQVILVPQTERLHYIQSLLQLSQMPLNGVGERVYVLYDYSRGSTLGYRPRFTLGFEPKTQEITASIRLVAERDGSYYLVEKAESTGGAGNETLMDLVDHAILPLSKLIDANPGVETDLEQIIAYACGIDLTPDLDYGRRQTLLAYALDSGNWADRRQAAEALGEINPLPVTSAPLMLSLLNDDGEGVAYTAEHTLSKMAEDPQVFDLLKESLANPDADIRAHTARIFNRLGSHPEVLVEPFLALLHDDDSFVRGEALTWLSYSDNLSVIPLVIKLFANDDPQTRAAAAEILGNFGAQAAAAIPGLTALLGDTSPDVRRSAAVALVGIGEGAKVALPELIQSVRRETDYFAFESEIYAVSTLGSQGEALALLQVALTSGLTDIRLSACNSLESYQGVPGAVELLIAAMGDADFFVRERAITSLYWHGPEAMNAVPALIAALGDPESRIRSGAASALKAITLQDFGEDAQKWTEWWEHNSNN